MKRVLLLAMLLAVAGCGYTTGSLLPSTIRTIAIEPFQNKVTYVSEDVRSLYVPLLETKVRTAVIDQFLFDGNLHIAKPENADLVLKGNLTGLQEDDLRVDSNQNVQEYRLTVIVSLTMLDGKTGKVLWKEPSFAGESTYFTSGPQAKSQSAALDDALTDLSRRVVERTVENW